MIIKRGNERLITKRRASKKDFGNTARDYSESILKKTSLFKMNDIILVNL